MRLAYGHAQYGYPQWRNFLFTTDVSGGESGAVNASTCAAWLTKVRNRAITGALRPQAEQRGGLRRQGLRPGDPAVAEPPGRWAVPGTLPPWRIMVG